jgi:hypothetical protein
MKAAKANLLAIKAHERYHLDEIFDAIRQRALKGFYSYTTSDTLSMREMDVLYSKGYDVSIDTETIISWEIIKK